MVGTSAALSPERRHCPTTRRSSATERTTARVPIFSTMPADMIAPRNDRRAARRRPFPFVKLRQEIAAVTRYATVSPAEAAIPIAANSDRRM